MNTDDALKWAFESDWGTDWGKDCKAMVQLAEEVNQLTAERDMLRTALITTGRNLGAGLGDEVTSEFLTLVAEEALALRAERDRYKAALEACQKQKDMFQRALQCIADDCETQTSGNYGMNRLAGYAKDALAGAEWLDETAKDELISRLQDKVSSFKRDNEWQIAQSVKMFKALRQLAKHCNDVDYWQIADEALAEAVRP